MTHEVDLESGASNHDGRYVALDVNGQGTDSDAKSQSSLNGVDVDANGKSRGKKMRQRSFLSRQDVLNAIEKDYSNLNWDEVIRQSKLAKANEDLEKNTNEMMNPQHVLHNPNLLNDSNYPGGNADDFDLDSAFSLSENMPEDLQKSRCSKLLAFCSNLRTLIFSHGRKFLFLVLTVVAFSLAVFYEKKFYYKLAETWLGIPIWRLLFYFSSAFPAWIISEAMLFIFLQLLSLLIHIQVFQDDGSVRDIILFIGRYNDETVWLTWSLWLTVAWGVFMSPELFNFLLIIFLQTDVRMTTDVNNNWLKYYDQILRLHIVLAVYYFGRLLVGWVGFKFLYRLSATHLSTKMFSTIFHQIVLLGLAGIRGSTSTLLVPGTLFKNGIPDGVGNKQKLEYAAARYIISNNMEKIFCFQLGLSTEKSTVVKQELLHRIKSNIRTQKQKLKLATANKHLEKSQSKLETYLKHAENSSVSKSTYQAVVPIKTTASEIFSRVNGINVGMKDKVRSDQNLYDKALLHSISQAQTETSSSTSKASSRIISKHLLESLLYSVYGDSLSYQEAFKLLDETETDMITLDSIKDLIEKAFDDRANLMVALGDSQEVTSEIKTWMQAVMNCIVIFLGFLICKVHVVTAWVSATSFVLGFSFVFGQTIKSIFENVVFLYGSHPYDVGDTIRLGTENRPYTVKRVLLQTTELLSAAAETRIIQNSKISQLEPLYNLTKSPGFWQESFFSVDATIVTDSFIQQVEEDMKDFLKTRPDLYHGYFRIDYCDLDAPLKVKMMLGVMLRITWGTPGPCRQAQSKACIKFIEAIVKHGGYRYSTYTCCHNLPRKLVEPVDVLALQE